MDCCLKAQGGVALWVSRRVSHILCSILYSIARWYCSVVLWVVLLCVIVGGIVGGIARQSVVL